MFTHNCIKCAASYEDQEQDPYYCPACNEAKMAIAREIDEKRKAMGPSERPKSDLQLYDEANKVRGFVNANIFS